MNGFRIVNETRHTILAESAREVTRLTDRLRGLLGREQLKAGQGLIIRPCTSIHSFFMNYSFDALFVGAAGEAMRLGPRQVCLRCGALKHSLRSGD